MYPLSGSFLNRLAHSHTRSLDVRIQLTKGRELAMDELPPITDGTVNYVNGSLRRRCNLTFETQTPTKEFLQALEDDNARYVVRAGALGRMWPIGVFYLRDYTNDDPGQNQNFRVQLVDESVLFAERKTVKAYTFQGDVGDIVREALKTTGRSLNSRYLATLGVKLPTVAIAAGTDPWTWALQLLEGYGYEMFMTRDGLLAIQELPLGPSRLGPDLTGLRLSKQATAARRSVNHIIVTSSSDDGGQYRGEVFDDNPTSPSYFYGSYGDVPDFVQVQGLGSDAACEAVAQKQAQVKFGRKVSTTYAMLQVPTFDVNDPYSVDGYLFTADQISYSLTPTRPMYLTGRGVPVAV